MKKINKKMIYEILKSYDIPDKYSIEEDGINRFIIYFTYSTLLVEYDEMYGKFDFSFLINNKTISIYEVLESIIDGLRYKVHLGINDLIVVNTNYEYNLAPSIVRAELSFKHGIEVILKYLQNVLKGDFSWIIKYSEFKKNTNLIQQVLDTPFVFEHPIYIKLLKGDETWLNDLNEINA